MHKPANKRLVFNPRYPCFQARPFMPIGFVSQNARLVRQANPRPHDIVN
jgi:hypothetical protein